MRRLRGKERVDERLFIAYLCAVLLGLVMIYSNSSVLADSRFGSQWMFLKNQMIWVGLSLTVIFAICRVDLQRFAVYSAPTLLIILVALALVFIMPARNGSHRWLMLGPFTVQPSELFKFALICYLAFSLSNPKRKLKEVRHLVVPYVPLIGLGLGLIILEPDLGSVIVISATALVMFFLAGARLKHLGVATVPIAAIGSFFVFVIGYKRDRIFDYIHSIGDPLRASYQAKQAALTLGAGGLFGTGLGEGRQKLFFLPYPHTDFIYAAMGEEIGLIGMAIVTGLLFYMLKRGFQIATRQPDKFGYLLASGMTLMLAISIILNIGVVTSLLPVTGLPLPFFSYGGSSLLVSSAAVGILLNLSRRGGARA